MKIVALDIQTLFDNAEDSDCIESNMKALASLYMPNDEFICCNDMNIRNYRHEDALNKAIAEAISDADVVISNKVKLHKGNLNSGIKLILVSGTGTNNINFADTNALNITVKNCVAYGINSVAQHTLGLILSLTNNITRADRHIRKGEWSESKNFCMCRYFFNTELEGSVLGIIGFGAIGKKVATMAKSLGMKVLVAERKNAESIRDGRTDFDEVISNSDVISVHCPLNDETRDLIGARELNMMKKSAYLVNVARGGVVNETSLYNALINNDIAGAATDVLTEEPPTTNVLLQDLDNLIVTPHIAWGSLNARKEIIRQMADNIAVLRDKKE